MQKLAFVTGGSRGIGRGIARRLLDDGYRVAIGYNTNHTLAQEAFKDDKNAYIIQVDISSRKSIRHALEETHNHFNQPVNILINNAAISQEKPFETITDDDWDSMMTINLRGVFTFSQEVIPEMQNQRWGRIINITSIGGQWGGFNQVHYAAAKAGVINFTRSLAKLFSADGILTNAISIGLVSTDMSAQELNSDHGKEKIKNIPAGRIGTVEEIAGTVSFLCRDDSSYITGQTINLNGGMYFD